MKELNNPRTRNVFTKLETKIPYKKDRSFLKKNRVLCDHLRELNNVIFPCILPYLTPILLFCFVILLLFYLQDEEHIKNVTQQFCDWVASLGGDSNNIEESTITSLFASGYETKPNLSVPIHVVELASVPPELRFSATTGPSIPQHSDPDSKPV